MHPVLFLCLIFLLKLKYIFTSEREIYNKVSIAGDFRFLLFLKATTLGVWLVRRVCFCVCIKKGEVVTKNINCMFHFKLHIFSGSSSSGRSSSLDNVIFLN